MAMQGRPGQGHLWSKCGHYYKHMKDSISKSPNSGLTMTQQASLKCFHFVDGAYATEVLELSIQTHTSCPKSTRTILVFFLKVGEWYWPILLFQLSLGCQCFIEFSYSTSRCVMRGIQNMHLQRIIGACTMFYVQALSDYQHCSPF